jgi:hypothetical protein
MSTKFLQRSFAGGEITPELAGRVDLTKYQTGLALARNFIVLPHGPAVRRPGTKYVNVARDSTKPVRLVPFSFSATQTLVLEFGHQYVRFHTNGATLLEDGIAISSIAGSTVDTAVAHGLSNGDQVFIGTIDGGGNFVTGAYHTATVVDTDTFTTTNMWGIASTPTGTHVGKPYTLVTPYDGADVFDLHFTQSADVITIVHPNYAARELARRDAFDWTLTTISFAPTFAVPTNLSATATVAVSTNLTDQVYVVTAVQADGVTESLASAETTCTNNLTLAGNFNTITWDGVDGAVRYHVYRKRSGVFGYIGQARPTAGSLVNISSCVKFDASGGGRFGIKKYYKVRVTTATSHGYTTGDYVFIQGTPYYDGYWQITVDNATQFWFADLNSAAIPNTGAVGTVSTPALSLIDDNILPDTTTVPPEDIIQLNTEPDRYPSAVVYHEQRRWFGGSDRDPQVVWATRTGTEKNLTSSFPSRDADGMELRIATSQYNKIRHLVALSDLIAFTAGGEFRIYSDSAPAITPTSVTVKPQGFAGASDVQPVVTTGSILYVQAQGARIRELSYNWEASAYRSIDMSIMAPHRFNGYEITQLAYARSFDQILWAVRNDGTLMGLTYVPEQQVYGWHAHDTDGTFESVAVVSENNEDVLYLVVRRTVNGQNLRYIERMSRRLFIDQEDAYFVDCGLTYDGVPATTFGGLTHLELEDVDILADGAVMPRQRVTNGQITLDTPASVVHIGLPYTSDLQTLPLAMEGAQAAGQGTVKNINKVHLRVAQSSIVKAGPAFNRLREYPARAVSDPYGSPPALRNGELALSVDPSWNQDGALCVRQDLPLPLSILSMTLEIQSGG